MELIKTAIVDPIYDALWNDATKLVADKTRKPVLVLSTDFPDNSSDHAQLKKMLDACKLSADKYHLLKLPAGQMVAWNRLKELLGPRIIFLIGVLPAQLGISALFNLNHPNHFDGCTWLPTLSIEELGKHDDMKKQLWINGMKPLFTDQPLPEIS